MAQPSSDKIVDIILGRRSVYGLDTDSRIRQVANRLTARALFELLGRLNDESPDFDSQLSTLLCEFSGDEVSLLIGFDTGDVSIEYARSGTPQQQESQAEYYLKLVFRNEDAAYYQFPLFPQFDDECIVGMARKRAGAVQHIRIGLTCPEALQSFIESCGANPHFLRVEKSSAEEFARAPSNAI